MEASAKYPLQRRWAIWEMWSQNSRTSARNFQDNMALVSSFDDLHSFWQHWLHLPCSSPQSVFASPETSHHRSSDQRQIEAIGVFEDQIVPAWEDQINSKGSDIALRLKTPNLASLKESWDNLVFSTIGETFPHSHCLTGVRIVDKRNCNYKFEVWLRVADGPSSAADIAEIKRYLVNTVFDRIFEDSEFSVTNHSTSEKRTKH
jgi:hypothetical protein